MNRLASEVHLSILTIDGMIKDEVCIDCMRHKQQQQQQQQQQQLPTSVRSTSLARLSISSSSIHLCAHS